MVEVNRLRQSDGPRAAILMRTFPAGNWELPSRPESDGRNLFEAARWVAIGTLNALPGRSQGGCYEEGDGNRFRNQS